MVSRNYLDFVLLAPQLTRSNIQGATGGKSALADSGFSFAGLRSRSNSLYIDGVENNDEFTGSARTELSPETVQEFQVVNNGLSAESGGGASGPINCGMRGRFAEYPAKRTSAITANQKELIEAKLKP